MFRVMLTEACPSISETILGFTSLPSSSVAQVWRRSWKRIGGSPMTPDRRPVLAPTPRTCSIGWCRAPWPACRPRGSRRHLYPLLNPLADAASPGLTI
jgi:hypothetical protein